MWITSTSYNSSLRNRAVWLVLCFFFNCSGVPAKTILPPFFPPSGPITMMWSAILMTSMLCSMMITVLPLLTNRSITCNNCSMSWKLSPVVGSSRIYNVFHVSFSFNIVWLISILSIQKIYLTGYELLLRRGVSVYSSLQPALFLLAEKVILIC